MDVIAEAIDKRAKSGKKFTIIAVAEGAISKEDAKLSKKELKDKQAKKKYPSVAYEMAEKSSEENSAGSAYRNSRTHTKRWIPVSI